MTNKTIPGKMVAQHGVEVHADEDGSLHVKAGDQKLDISAGTADTLYSLIGDVMTWADPADAA